MHENSDVEAAAWSGFGLILAALQADPESWNLTESAEHGPAGVDDLDLTVAGEGLGVGRQASCVPACQLPDGHEHSS